MLYNTLFDPREILELLHIRSFDADHVTALLMSTYLGALQAWCRALSDHDPASN
jgi:hypothetical protein